MCLSVSVHRGRQGYALIEYGEKEEADRAIKDLNGTDFLGQTLKVDFAFVKRK